MTTDGWITLAITAAALAALARDLAPDLVFMAAAVALTLTGVITPAEAFAGFANAGVLTVGALFVVAAALTETGVMGHVGEWFLGRVATERAGLARLAALVVPLSAVLNNTPIVAMLIPVVIDWCRKREISPSRLLMPLSFLTILGGTCSLIGTSTNLIVQGLAIKAGLRPMGLFEIGYAGVPCALCGVAYLLTVGRRLLPQRKELLEQLGEARREYVAEMLVQPGCRLVGQTVEAAGLRRLPGLFLVEIERAGELIAPVGPDETIRATDRLVFAGIVATIVGLEKIPGLVPAADATYEVSPRLRRGRQLSEAVISPSSPLIGKDIRNADFRAHYGAAVVAVHRNGARLRGKVGDVVLRAGDTLLLQTGPHFNRAHRNNPDFYLVSPVEGSRPLRHDLAWIASTLFLILITLMASGTVPVEVVAFLIAGLMVATRCISASDARQAVQWPVLVAIAAAFGLGTALENSGVAGTVAHLLVTGTSALGPTAALAAIYFGTMVLNELISNNAAAVLAFPFGIEAAEQLGVGPYPFVIAVALAASNAYATPIGYQTHMMVYGPGGYRFTDFLRVGVPLNLICWAVAMVAIPFWWPWH